VAARPAGVRRRRCAPAAPPGTGRAPPGRAPSAAIRHSCSAGRLPTDRAARRGGPPPAARSRRGWGPGRRHRCGGDAPAGRRAWGWVDQSRGIARARGSPRVSQRRPRSPLRACVRSGVRSRSSAVSRAVASAASSAPALVGTIARSRSAAAGSPGSPGSRSHAIGSLLVGVTVAPPPAAWEVAASRCGGHGGPCRAQRFLPLLHHLPGR